MAPVAFAKRVAICALALAPPFFSAAWISFWYLSWSALRSLVYCVPRSWSCLTRPPMSPGIGWVCVGNWLLVVVVVGGFAPLCVPPVVVPLGLPVLVVPGCVVPLGLLSAPVVPGFVVPLPGVPVVVGASASKTRGAGKDATCVPPVLGLPVLGVVVPSVVLVGFVVFPLDGSVASVALSGFVGSL